MDILNQLIALLKPLVSTWQGIGALLIGVLLVTIAALLVGIAICYLLGKLKPLKLPIKPALCGCEPTDVSADIKPPGVLESILLTIDYLRTRREWCYEKPWIMMLGELGAGKTSLLASVPVEHKQALSGRDKQLAISGIQWHYLHNGFFIDPDGLLLHKAASLQDKGSQEHTQAEKRWDAVLDRLNALRPERALDGILLVISAASLQQQSRDERQATAANIRQQLHHLEQQTEFALPVYVVVTALDSVSGFAAFWRAQSPARTEEIIGWSSPTQSLESPPDAWVGEAFKQVARQLKPLQLEAAAQHALADTNEADESFLFPRCFQQLREPLQESISIIFQGSAWQAPFFCRGIYFTGVIAAKGTAPVEQELPRNDVSFISDIILKKILAEPGLARPTRAGVWSRNRLIRRLQIASVTAFGILLLALAVTCFQIDTQVDTVINTLKRIEQMQASVQSDGSCILQEPVFQLLDQIGTINAEAASWVIPVSFIDNRLSRQSAQRIANDAFKNVILPGLACHINARATAVNKQSTQVPESENYPEALAALQSYVTQVNDVEKNVARFKHVLAAPPFARVEDTLPEFFKLTEYAYGAELPAKIKSNPGLLSASLASLNKSVYSPDVTLPANFKMNASRYIVASAGQVNTQLSAELERGSQLLSLLQQKQQPILPNIKHFIAWVNWVRASWIGSSSTQNPILQIQTDLNTQLQPLIRDYAYPAGILKSASAQFDAANHYSQAMDRLNKMQLPAYGNLFTVQNKQLDLNPELNAELVGLQAVSELAYMAIDPVLPFVCQGKVASWSPDDLNATSDYFKQYQGLVSNPLLKNAGKNLLYQQLAAYQLELVLNNSLRLAQSSALATDLALTNSDTGAIGSLVEQQQSRDTLKFAKLLPIIQSLQGIYNSLAFNASATSLDKCVSQFANDNLAQIQLITEQSLLYQITVTAAASAPATNATEASADFFDLGSTAVVQDFLTRQINRVQVLAAYAGPFLDYLKPGTTDPSPNTSNPDTAPYWNNTVQELQRYTQAKDPNAQATLLNNLFLKQFPGMNSGNCHNILSGYQAPDYGNDLFSNYRHQLEQAVTSLCNGKRSSQAANLYQQWATRFNKELAGRYPFGALSSADANLTTVKAFFNDYEANKAALSQSLSGFTGTSWAERRVFLSQLDSVAAFLHNSLTQSSPANTKLNLAIGFRALAGEGSEQVSLWQLSSANNSIAYPNQGTNLDWPYGQSLALNLVWASNSAWRPAFAGSTGDLKVEGLTATFAASGNWALLRFIANHQPHSGAQLDSPSTNTLLLEFDVPLIGADQPTNVATAKSGNATLYLSMQLSSIDPTTLAPASLTLPDIFPSAAPQ